MEAIRDSQRYVWFQSLLQSRPWPKSYTACIPYTLTGRFELFLKNYSNVWQNNGQRGENYQNATIVLKTKCGVIIHSWVCEKAQRPVKAVIFLLWSAQGRLGTACRCHCCRGVDPNCAHTVSWSRDWLHSGCFRVPWSKQQSSQGKPVNSNSLVPCTVDNISELHAKGASGISVPRSCSEQHSLMRFCADKLLGLCTYAVRTTPSALPFLIPRVTGQRYGHL